MTAPKRLVVMGLPESGKTTFLAAFWHTLGIPDVPNALTVVRQPTNREYLNKIANKWLRFEEVGRTDQGETPENNMLLLDPATLVEVELEIPDMAGEIYRQQWAFRTCDPQYLPLVQAADYFMLFIGPHVQEMAPLADAQRALQGLEADEAEDGPEVPTEWDPEKSPTQVKLVDILQILVDQRPSRALVRLALVVSAWDSIEAIHRVRPRGGRRAELTPDTWLEQTLPLLHQYLQGNAATFTVQVFGISAQGGDVKNPHDVERLSALDVTTDRVNVVCGTNCTNDVTTPIRWLLGGAR